MTDRGPPTRNDPGVEPASAPWFDQPGEAGQPSWWVRYRDWIWSAVIVVVVVGLGAWDVITHGPIHPHV